MNYNHITKAYQNAERQALEQMNDPHLIVLTMFDALLKSMQIFETNIDLKNGGDAELKSKHFGPAQGSGQRGPEENFLIKRPKVLV